MKFFGNRQLFFLEELNGLNQNTYLQNFKLTFLKRNNG